MTNCQICGKQVDMPFVCHYCGGYFCVIHRFPEAHSCYAVNQRVPTSESDYVGSIPTMNLPPKNPMSANRKSSWPRKVVGIAIAIVLVLSIAYFLSNFYASPIALPVTSPIIYPVISPVTITGNVVSVVGSAIDGNISGVEVSVIDSKGDEVATCSTNATGGFSFRDLPQSSYTVQITVPYGHIALSATSYVVTNSRNVQFRLQNLLVNAKTMHYSYTLRGISSEIAFTVYEGMCDYLVSIENSTVSYYAGQEPSPEEVDRIVTLRYVNEDVEQGELNKLVKAIKQITPNEDDQARIAISFVQNIPYDWNALHLKYPYEVLYSNKGDCDEKSGLLVSLLRELGYGCSILSFPSQSHAAVGIACPAQYEYYSEYAFVESTSPTIITGCTGDYVGAGKLPSSPSYIIVIHNGKVMNSVSEEYQDAQTFQSLINMGPVLDEYHYTQWQMLVSKYGLQTS